MRRIELERQFTLMVEWEVLRQLREKFGDGVTYNWVKGPLTDGPLIEVNIARAAIELPVQILAGQVYIRNLRDGFIPDGNGITSTKVR